ncbi:mitogen-activated protein kinase kinase kinase 18 [Setaria viridis]|uniref:Protein kinase domain-containing protein n=1 Tax=Setaria viridis TaxID=4556 RepID=A0A4U6WB55_SETVI|nr:mitogen-activated protein kinase kinase kinase 18-like [Setaria viridis]TKW38883.1 hypothetical protein SEVIR_1G143600v2 [Setaria viridis]
MPMAPSYIYSAHTPKEAEHKQQQHILHISSSPIVPSALPPPTNNDDHRKNKKQQEEKYKLRLDRLPFLRRQARARMGATGEWQRGPVIGHGASATVSIATDRRTGGVFAVKSVELARAGVLQREQSVLSALSSPYVVSCLGADVSVAADGSRRMCYDLFLEYAPGGSLADEIKRRGGRCEEAVIRSRAADVLRGLAYVHGSGVTHCDVKGRNVLLRADGRAMLADFGCARLMANEDGNAGVGAGGMIVRGTPMFMSPEAARGEAQGAAADIWALGCTVIEMATGGAPWQQRFADPVAALHHIAHSGDVPQAPAWLSDEAKDFLSRCLIMDPAKRWSAEQLLQHQFVASSSAPIDPASVKAAPIELRVSPKSVLDQAFWEDSDSDTTVSLTPADRVRALAYDVAADWTWSGEHWITVCAHAGIFGNNDDTAASPRFEAGAGSSITGVSEEQIGSGGGGGGGEHMRVDAPRGDASSHGHHQGSSAVHGDADADASSGSGSSSSRCNSVISGSNSDSCCSSSSNFASSGNKRCCCSVVNDAGLVTFRPSWQQFTFQRAASFLPFGECPFRHVAGVSRNLSWILEEGGAVVVVVTAGPGSLRLTLGRASRGYSPSRSQSHSLSRRIENQSATKI